MGEKTPTHLHDILALAEIHERTWFPKMHALRASGVPLNLDDDKPLIEQLRERRSTLLAEAGTQLDARQTVRDEFRDGPEKTFTERTATFAAVASPTDEMRSAFNTDRDGFNAQRSKFDAEETAFGEAHDARMEEIRSLDRRIDEQELQERRRADAASASRNDARVKGEPLTYRRDNGKDVSYYTDLAVAQLPHIRAQINDPEAALSRLERHSKEMADEMPKREKAREARAQAAMDQAEREFRGSFLPHAGVQRRGLDDNPFERRVNPNRTDGQGGYFVPPLWLIDEYITALRAGRVAANLCRQFDLPQGTDSINIPKIATGTTVAPQTADGQAVSSTDFTDTVVTAGVKTIAGQQDVSLQLVEQSPGRIIDQAIFEDLTRDYGMKVDQQVLLGTGANGQVLGLLPIANWSGNTVTWTSSTPLGQSFHAALNASASKASYNRYDLSDLASLVHPRRGFWYGSTLDGASGTTGRPLVNPRDTGANVVAVADTRLPAEGRMGVTSLGYGIYMDGNLPIIATAAGAVTGGTNDLSVSAHWDDAWLFEGQLRNRVLSEVLSGTLQVRFQVYNYVAFLLRYGQSVSVVQGTGMSAPTYAGDTTITF